MQDSAFSPNTGTEGLASASSSPRPICALPPSNMDEIDLSTPRVIQRRLFRYQSGGAVEEILAS
ncbi:hypothetical protein BS78_08G087800 [Paspalum vaginatum]|nr:hypothetical protein BS78_08G087800 [Paspalum vaginatum]